MNRDKNINIESLELAQPGFANGISTHLQEAIKKGAHELNQEDKRAIIAEAAEHYGNFLTALGVDWKNDPNSSNTPMRVAKAYVNDLWRGRYEQLDSVTSFPSDGYDGVVFEGGIPITSMCSHHHQTINGLCHIAYVPTLEGRVVGLSKLNRIVEHFSRRGAIQEQLTVAIHNAVNQICEGNIGVAVMIEATHNCVSCRGVKHQGANMKTSKLTGCFLDEDSARLEFYEFVKGYPRK
jgi:GTP cyclohydrolase IA